MIARFCFYTLIIYLFISCTGDRTDERPECNFPFKYSFYKYKVNFPMSVDDAINSYGFIRTDSRILRNNVDPQKTDITAYYDPGVNLPRYTPRTTKASSLYYNTDIYAVAFHLRDPTIDIKQVLNKLTKDLKKSFQIKQVPFVNNLTYYEMEINDCEIVCVYENQNTRDMDYTNAIHVVFTYKVNQDEIPIFIDTNGRLIVD